jgi:hypothetical protein
VSPKFFGNPEESRAIPHSSLPHPSASYPFSIESDAPFVALYLNRRLWPFTALNSWTGVLAAGTLDPQELLARAVTNIPQDRSTNGVQIPTLLLAISAGPTQAVLRPSDLESGILQDDILKAAMFDYRIFDKSVGSKSGLVGDALVVRQERGASVQLDAQGDFVLQLPAAREGGSFFGALIQEDFESLAESGLTYLRSLAVRQDRPNATPISCRPGGDRPGCELSDLANQDAAWSQSEFIVDAHRERKFQTHSSHAGASTPAGLKAKCRRSRRLFNRIVAAPD